MYLGKHKERKKKEEEKKKNKKKKRKKIVLELEPITFELQIHELTICAKRLHVK